MIFPTENIEITICYEQKHEITAKRTDYENSFDFSKGSTMFS